MANDGAGVLSTETGRELRVGMDYLMLAGNEGDRGGDDARCRVELGSSLCCCG